MVHGDDFRVDPVSGLVSVARQVSSPNCDARPAGMQPDLIVIHGISLPPGEFGGEWITQLFTNTLAVDAHPYFNSVATLRVSAHLLVRRDGTVVQYVPFHLRAWHAGVSNYEGREKCNDFSVGIELEGTDENPYEPRQYVSLARLVVALSHAYRSLAPDRLTGHSDVAPGR